MNRPSPKHLKFSCPSCLRAIKASLIAAGKTLPCPGCEKEITVPTLEESGLNVADNPLSSDEYGVVEPVECQPYKPAIIPGLDHTYESDLDVNTYRESNSSYKTSCESKSRAFTEHENSYVTPERPKLPPYPMFTGIFSMFADASTMSWFIWLTLFLTLPMTLPIGIVLLIFIHPFFAVVSIIMFLVSGLWAVFGLSFLAIALNCFLAILQDSAVGKKRIESWPNKTEGGYFTGSIFVIAALSYSIGVGWLIGWLFHYNDCYWYLILLIVYFFTFPFFLVSLLEVGSPLIPISKIMLRSFFACFLTWITFYVESAILCAIGLGGIAITLILLPHYNTILCILCAFLLGPLFTFLSFLYFRLLGRLVWVCDNWLRSLESDEESY